MKDNQYFNVMQKRLDGSSHEDIEFFLNARNGKNVAFGTWLKGIKRGLDFPLLTYPLYEDEISDFLKTLEKAGFKKFGFSVYGKNSTKNITEFQKAGWKLTGTFEILEFDDEPFTVEAFIFEK